METITASSGNVFADIGFKPDEAANLQIRSQLLSELAAIIAESGMTQTQASAMLGIQQSRISDIMRGKIQRFSVDALIKLLAAAGHRVNVQVTAMAM